MRIVREDEYETPVCVVHSVSSVRVGREWTPARSSFAEDRIGAGGDGVFQFRVLHVVRGVFFRQRYRFVRVFVAGRGRGSLGGALFFEGGSVGREPGIFSSGKGASLRRGQAGGRFSPDRSRRGGEHSSRLLECDAGQRHSVSVAPIRSPLQKNSCERRGAIVEFFDASGRSQGGRGRVE